MNETLGEETVVVAIPEQVCGELEGEAVILNLRSGIYFGLSAVGARIWQHIQEPRRVDGRR